VPPPSEDNRLRAGFSLRHTRGSVLASDQSQIERTPFFWRHYVRSFTIFFSKRHLGGRSSHGFQLPKLLKFTEDAHPKNMSTFEADEHLRGCKAGPGTYWYAESAAKVLG
jgi:hypothetical protein